MNLEPELVGRGGQPHATTAAPQQRVGTLNFGTVDEVVGEVDPRSDGSDRLHFHDPQTFAETGSVAVTLRGTPVTRLNELDVINRVWTGRHVHYQLGPLSRVVADADTREVA